MYVFFDWYIVDIVLHNDKQRHSQLTQRQSQMKLGFEFFTVT